MTVLVTGAGGFIGGHLVKALLDRGEDVRAADVKPLGEWHQVHDGAGNRDEWDLRSWALSRAAARPADTVFALAADMGGMGYLTFHEADVLTANQLISVNTIRSAVETGVSKVVYASSACVYPEYRQETPYVKPLAESDAYPAQPDLAYGWEKLVTERLLAAYHAEGRLGVRIARLHNIYGPEGTWDGGREKAPAALCRKAAEAPDGGEIEVWGDGQQTRSFCYITDCIDGLLRLADSDHAEPLNIGSSELTTIDGLAHLAITASGKDLTITHVDGPQGVRGRNSDNTLCRKVLGWEPQVTLEEGMARTYDWIADQVAAGPDCSCRDCNDPRTFDCQNCAACQKVPV